jgi:transmembrane sensor
MKKYENYKAEDFALDGDFRDWVQGKGSQTDFWLAFIQQHPELHEVIGDAEELVRAMHVQTEPVVERLVRAEVNEFMKRAAQSPPYPRPAGVLSDRSYSWRPAFSYAAALALIVLLFMAGWRLGNSLELKNYLSEIFELEEIGVAYTETRNDTDKSLKLVLSDSSIVHLGPKSVLRYTPHFSGNERVVHLKGEGQFDIVKRKEPFKVYAGGLVTKVLGTRFSIRAYGKNEKVTVQVQSGKVSVFQKHTEGKMDATDKAGIILLPNQAAVYNHTENQLSKTIVENPTIQMPQTTGINFEFKEIPLTKVLQQLQQAYAIPIQFDEEALQKCKITASLTNETLIEKVAILCKLVGGWYEIVDGQIIVRADGCR